MISFGKRLAWCTVCLLAMIAAAVAMTVTVPAREGGIGTTARLLGVGLLGSVLIGLYLTVRLRVALRRDFTRLRRAIRDLAGAEASSAHWRFECEELQACSDELATAARSLHRRYTRLSADATLDALTGLANRRTLMFALERETALSLRTGWPLALVMIDIDHFKNLNDSHGHQAGDVVLQRTAHRLASLVRESDVVARFGGEEFAVLLPGTHLDHAVEIAGQLRNALRCNEVQYEGNKLAVTASFGVAELHECALADTESLISAADTALYAAKSAGRDQVMAADKADATGRTAPSADRMAGLQSNPTTTHAPDTSVDRDTMALMGSTFSVLQVMPDRQRVAQDILQQITALLQHHDGAFFIRRDDTLHVIARARGNLTILSAENTPSGFYEPRFADMTELDPSSVAETTEARVLDPDDVCSVRRVVLPLHHGSHLAGVVQVAVPAEYELSKRQRTVLTALGAIGAAALKNCDAFKRYEERWIGLIEALCRTIHSHLAYKRDHGERVGALVTTIARAMGQRDEDELQLLRIAGLVHDIGKIGLPAKLFHKRGSLKPSERKTMQMHCRIGADIINSASGMQRLAAIVRHHHEHYDGGGYPDGLAGDEIPIESRVLAVADAFDAMISERPYRRALPHEEAIRRIKQAAGTQFDPNVVAAFLERFAREDTDDALWIRDALTAPVG